MANSGSEMPREDEPDAAPRPEPTRWEIPVLDAHDRRRDLMVVVSEGQVVLLPPPGEACILPQSSDEPLFAAIRQAREAARQVPGQQP